MDVRGSGHGSVCDLGNIIGSIWKKNIMQLLHFNFKHQNTPVKISSPKYEKKLTTPHCFLTMSKYQYLRTLLLILA